MAKNKDADVAFNIFKILFILAIISTFFVIITPGQRGVLTVFGKVQNEILEEGLHFVIPVVNTVEKLSVRVQKQDLSAEASSKDLQGVFTDVSLNWHLIPEEVNMVYQQIGDLNQVIDRLIDPAIEEILKAVMAKYTAEEIITKREEVKTQVDVLLAERLRNYHIFVDDLSLVHVRFSEKFREAVEAKQIAEQEAKKAEFIAKKAIKEAETQVNLAKGEAEAMEILEPHLTPEILEKKMIDKWDGNLPLIIGDKNTKILDIKEFLPRKK